jgi:hypothetical protein
MNVGQSRAGNSAYFLLWIACARSLTRGVLAVLPGSRKNFPVGSSIFSWAEADAISAARSRVGYGREIGPRCKHAGGIMSRAEQVSNIIEVGSP